MPARQTDVAHSIADALQHEAAPPQAEAAAPAEFSTEGAVPAVNNGATEKVGETASEQAFGHKPTAPAGQVDAGMYTHEEYRSACVAAGTPDKWEDRFWRGHTAAKQWTQPYEGRYDNAFELKKRESASQAVKDFLAGPTISDYRVLSVAIQMNELRDDVGDHRFDQLFGTKDVTRDGQIPPAQRLKITSAMYTIPFRAQMLALAQENEDLDKKASEPAPPVVAAGMEEQPQVAGVESQPAPEMIADELGMQREQEMA
jgi:hypothetical protein